jgi:hypothetical protein
MVTHSFLISKFELVWIIWENIKTVGAQPPASRSEPRCRPCWQCMDCDHRLTTHCIRRPLFPPPRPPPLAALNGAPRRRAPPFSPPLPLMPRLCSSSRCADAGRCTSVHWVPPPPATPLPDRRLLELHPAPVHLRNPSNSGPDHPFGPSPLLLPARRAPLRMASSVSPRPPQLLLWFLPPRRRASPPFPPVPDFWLAGIGRCHRR